MMLGRVTGLLNMQMGHVGIELSAEHRIWTEPIEFFIPTIWFTCYLS